MFYKRNVILTYLIFDIEIICKLIYVIIANVFIKLLSSTYINNISNIRNVNTLSIPINFIIELYN